MQQVEEKNEQTDDRFSQVIKEDQQFNTHLIRSEPERFSQEKRVGSFYCAWESKQHEDNSDVIDDLIIILSPSTNS